MLESSALTDALWAHAAIEGLIQAV